MGADAGKAVGIILKRLEAIEAQLAALEKAEAARLADAAIEARYASRRRWWRVK